MSFKKQFSIQKVVAMALAFGVTGACAVITGCGKETGTSQNTGNTSEVSQIDTQNMFTDRDKEIGYDEENAVTIILADTGITCDSQAVSIAGSTVTIKDEGTYILQGSLSNGQVIVEAEDTDKPQLVLDNVNITCESSAPIYIKQADKVFITLAKGSENTVSSTGTFVNIDDNNIDAAIFSKDDVTLNGAGVLNIQCETGHGVVSKDDLVITSGEYYINAASHALSGKDSVRIADGVFTLCSGKDGIHAENEDDTTLGFIYIAEGTLEITGEDDGIDAATALTIDGGTIDIVKSNEGLEGMNIDINGGDISITASDDGINASGGNSSGMQGDSSLYVNITGGTVIVNAAGDGIDSNGNLYVSGGTLYVSGAANSGNGALDYAMEAKITGGTVIAAGASGMAVNFGENSTQCSIMVNIQNMVQGEITLKNSDNEILASYTPETAYNSVVISVPEIEIGKTYYVTMAGEETTVEVDSVIYGNSGMNQMPGNMGQPGNGGMVPGNGEMMPGNDGMMPENAGELPEDMENQGGRPGGAMPNNGGTMPEDLQNPPEEMQESIRQ